MTEITPEMLKEIAEAVGEQVIAYPRTGRLIILGGPALDFQPHKDWNQCGELLE